MRILLAADGSPFTRKALDFLVANKALLGSTDELLVVNVQTPVPGRVTTMLGSAEVAAYHAEEANKVLDPIRDFLEQQGVRYRAHAVVGAIVEEIIFAARKESSQMIVMGTHGLGWIGRAIMGSVAQRVVADSEIPVLLVR